MVLLDIECIPKATWIFEVDLTSLENEPKVIKCKYEPVIIIRHIRQVCKIRNTEEFAKNEDNINTLSIKNNSKINDDLSDDLDDDYKPQIKKIKRKIKNSENNKNNGDILIYPKLPIKLYLQFKNFPEYINAGDNVIINDNLLRAFGVVNCLIK